MVEQTRGGKVPELGAEPADAALELSGREGTPFLHGSVAGRTKCANRGRPVAARVGGFRGDQGLSAPERRQSATVQFSGLTKFALLASAFSVVRIRRILGAAWIPRFGGAPAYVAPHLACVR